MPKYQAPEPPEIDVEEFRKVVQSRRSVRRFTDEPIPEAVVQDCLDMALLAPNSSNLQPWMFYRIRSPDRRKRMVEACLNQNAAKTAAELIVVVARTTTWKKHCAEMLDHWPEESIPRVVEDYYTKAAMVHYGQIPLDPMGRIKKLFRNIMGLTRPAPRWPNSQADMKLWACKSTALAAENLMLAFRAHGFDSCPMEGFDEARLRRIVQLPRDGFVVMVVAAGRRADNGIYHDQIRFDRQRFIQDI
ncbi:MAG: nitroreductase family protein [Salinisphaeraceae bacterium]|nr:nitroreductase family protein [Salinisphaeraceae bacterium]